MQQTSEQPPATYTGLRPDWVRLPPMTPTPSPAPTNIAPTPSPEPSSPAEVAPPPVEAEPPPEPIAIAAAPPSAEAQPTDAPEAAPPTIAEAPTITEGLDLALAEDIVQVTNEARMANGLTTLVEHPALIGAAQAYADLHAHVSPDRLDHTVDGSTLGSRADAAGYVGWTFLGENLLWSTFDGCRSAQDLVQEWLDSPAHRDNLLNPVLNEIGVGCYVSAAERPFCICAQEFGARPS